MTPQEEIAILKLENDALREKLDVYYKKISAADELVEAAGWASDELLLWVNDEGALSKAGFDIGESEHAMMAVNKAIDDYNRERTK